MGRCLFHQGRRSDSTSFYYLVLQELRRKKQVFQDLFAFKDAEMAATISGHPELIAVEMLSGSAFNTLGLRADYPSRKLRPARS